MRSPRRSAADTVTALLAGLRPYGSALPPDRQAAFAAALDALDQALANLPVADLRAREQAAQALAESKERFQSLVETISETIWELDATGRYTYLSPNVVDLLGYQPEEMLGKTPIEFMPAEDAALMGEMLTELLAHPRALSGLERAFIHKDGRARTIESSDVPIRGPRGAFAGYRGIARDVTARKQAEEELHASRQMLQLVLDTIPQRVFWKDRDCRYLGCNKHFAIDAGLTDPDQIVGKSDLDLSWAAAAKRYREDDQRVMEQNAAKLNREEPRTRTAGPQLWLRTNKAPLHDREGRVIGILGTYEDITDRKQSEAALRAANVQLTQTVGDLERRNHEANLLRQMSDLLQVSNAPEEADAVVRQFGPQLFPAAAGALYLISNSRNMVEATATWGDPLQSERLFAPADCWALRRGKSHLVQPESADLTCRHATTPFAGSYLDVPMMASGDAMGLLRIEQAEPITEATQELARVVGEHLALAISNIKLRELLRSQSIRDQLTGLYNRRYMEETLERELCRARRQGSAISLIMLDLDRFKEINDTYGHEAGDGVLAELGAMLGREVRREDVPCRLGGDEFVLILPDAPLEVALDRAERIRARVEAFQAYYRHQPIGPLSVSMGIAAYPAQGEDIDALLHQADEALYRAKQNGRNRVEAALAAV